MRGVFLWLVLAISSFSVFAEELKIDGSSPAAFKSSFGAIMKGLPAEKKEAYSEAGQMVMLSGVTLADMMAASALGEEGSEVLIAKYAGGLTGMTAVDVVTKAKAIADAKLDGKADEMALQAASSTGLSKIVLSDVVISKKEEVVGGERVQIAVSVMNGATVAVSKVYFKGVVTTEGRSTPWIKESVDYAIPGGIEPGETRKLELAPNIFNWPAENVPDGAGLKLVLYRVDNADGEKLWEVADSKAAAKLTSLQKKADLFTEFLK